MKTLKMMDGSVMELTNEEAVKIGEVILGGKSKYASIKKSIIAISSISGIYDSEAIDRKSQKTGVLHDGTPVVKQFGIWYDAMSVLDEKGLHTVRLDPAYYPETVMDCVATEREWEELKSLPPGERKRIMIGGARRGSAQTDGDFKRIGN